MNIVEKIFLEVLNLSLSGSFVILGILFLRLLLKKTPHKYAYFLWIFAGIRLVCTPDLPIFAGHFPVKQDVFVYENLAYQKPHIRTGFLRLDEHVSQFLQEHAAVNAANSVNPMQLIITAATLIWAAVLVGLCIYQIAKYLTWKRRLSTAVFTEEEGIYETDQVSSPVLFGLLKPIIYVPLAMEEQDRIYAIAHEQVHRSRRDSRIKLIAYGILAVHWFNPLCWLAFYCMVLDMEMSCDEAVLKQLNDAERVNYGKALLNESLKRSGFSTLHALAFGSGSTKKRLKNILHYKKTRVCITIFCFLVLLTALFLFMGNGDTSNSMGVIGGADGPTAVFVSGTDGFFSSLFHHKESSENAEKISLASDAWFQELCAGRHPYVGDASANGKVMGYAGMVLPDSFQWAGQELQTSKEPYEIWADYTEVSFEDFSEWDIQCSALRYSAILFATVENTGVVGLKLTGTDDNVRILSYTREQVEELLGCSGLYDFSQDTESMKEYMNLVSERLLQFTAE